MACSLPLVFQTISVEGSTDTYRKTAFLVSSRSEHSTRHSCERTRNTYLGEHQLPTIFKL